MRWAVHLKVDGVRQVHLAPRTVVAGRDPGCALRVGDLTASRRHCRFTIAPPAVRVHDLGSRHGTHVNGVPVDEHDLADGDEVRIGSTIVRIAVTPAQFAGYTLEKELGGGAQGTVFLARHANSGPAAVKVLHDMTPQTAALLIREVTAMRALRHPNIVPLLDAGTEPVPFLVSSYCDGGSIEESGKQPLVEAVRIIRDVLTGLAHAHSAEVPGVRLADGTTRSARGIVHRDVKPQNVLLHGGVARLADFGLAKAFDLAGLSEHTRTGEVGGSLGFMPRAQILNYRYAPPSVDVWACAATLYWMLTGTTPRDFPAGADPVAVVLREPAVPIRAREPALPARLAAAVDEVLTEDEPVSAERFRDMLIEAG
ncbi:protein kinase [Lentzea sp. CC55]|uniref:protein kinase domain-containing protein n=1 Tax=Lentzea sp. CC55 TaxID=2884909 RepID=UPI0027E010F7|nr:FHA domain-containing serine/threonine-protein kinase [Lentzea sp. CC55]MCG8927315.1 FHA domain-containing serine/threonine-protein kinase [Lentzea sp. CC55]